MENILINAELSICKKYRYSLTRIWDEDKPNVMFVMLNPSTADEKNDDPTIRRCINFAKDFGAGGIYVVNLFPLRATNPNELLINDSIISEENKNYIKKYSELSSIIICAWGNNKIIKRINKKFNTNVYNQLKLINSELYCLELSKDNTPKHPLYLPKNLKPIKFNLNLT